MGTDSIEMRKLEIEAQERREEREFREKAQQRNSDLFKWFVMLALQPFIGLATTYFTTQHQNSLALALKTQTQKSASELKEETAKSAKAIAAQAEIAADKADKAVELIKKVDETSTSTNAITARWWGDRNGDPKAAAKADESERRLESMNPTPASAAPPP